jgi:hypothetical protein
MKIPTGSVFALVLGLLAACPVWSLPVVYTVKTVASGHLGTVSFANARLTISFTGDTRNVRTDISGALVNRVGTATLSIIRLDGRTLRAKFRAGEIYVRYDTSLGLVGFASALGYAYPVMVGCFDPPTCSNIYFDSIADEFPARTDGLATQLATLALFPASFSAYVSDFTSQLPTNLSGSTLLTGFAHACTVDFGPGGSCPSGPTSALHTDSGDFLVSDMQPADGPQRVSDTDHVGTNGIFIVTVIQPD